MNFAPWSEGIWLTQRSQHFLRIADSQRPTTQLCKWREWRPPVPDTVSRPCRAIMLSVLNVPPWRLGNKLIDWCCSSMAAGASATSSTTQEYRLLHRPKRQSSSSTLGSSVLWWSRGFRTLTRT